MLKPYWISLKMFEWFIKYTFLFWTVLAIVSSLKVKLNDYDMYNPMTECNWIYAIFNEILKEPYLNNCMFNDLTDLKIMFVFFLYFQVTIYKYVHREVRVVRLTWSQNSNLSVWSITRMWKMRHLNLSDPLLYQERKNLMVSSILSIIVQY